MNKIKPELIKIGKLAEESGVLNFCNELLLAILDKGIGYEGSLTVPEIEIIKDRIINEIKSR